MSCQVTLLWLSRLPVWAAFEFFNRSFDMMLNLPSPNSNAARLSLLVILVAAWLGGASNGALASQSVELTWSPSPNTDVVAYKVYYGTESRNYSGSITFSDVSDVILPGLAGGVTYYFAVSAVNANAEESDLSNEADYTVPLPAPLVLQVQGASSYAQAVELTWNPSPDGDVYAYNVSYGTQSGVYTNSTTFYGTTDGVISGLAGGATYYFAVAAIDSVGVENILSNEVSYVIPAQAPIALQMQTFTDESGQTYLMHINTGVAVNGYWEMDKSPDLQTWSPHAYGYGYGYGDGSDVDVYAWMNGGEPQMFFRLVLVSY